MPLWGIDAVTIRLSMFFFFFSFFFVTRSHKKQCRILIPRDAPVGHRRGNNPVEYVIFFIPRDAPVGHRRGNNPVEYVFFIFVTRSHKKQCRILIEV